MQTTMPSVIALSSAIRGTVGSMSVMVVGIAARRPNASMNEASSSSTALDCWQWTTTKLYRPTYGTCPYELALLHLKI